MFNSHARPPHSSIGSFAQTRQPFRVSFINRKSVTSRTHFIFNSFRARASHDDARPIAREYDDATGVTEWCFTPAIDAMRVVDGVATRVDGKGEGNDVAKTEGGCA